MTYRALSTISPRIMRTRHQCKQPKSVNYKLFLRPAPNIAVARSADDFYFFPKQIEDLEYDRSFFYLPLDEDVTIETEITKIIDEAVERHLTQRAIENVARTI